MTDKRFHILQLPSWYLPEGGQFCRNQTILLKEFGHNVRILANVSLSWKKYRVKVFRYIIKSHFCKEDNITILRNFFVRIPTLNSTNGKLWSWITLVQFKKYVKVYGLPDIIHVHSVLWGGYAAYLIKKKYGVPYVITEHKGSFLESCDFAIKQFTPELETFMSKAFSKADHIVTVSSKQIPKIKSLLTLDVPISTISNIVDSDFFFYKERRQTSEKIKFVAVNGFNPSKAFDILLPAFDEACNINDKIELTIVGEDFHGAEFTKLWNTIQNKNSFDFKGEVDSFGVREELHKADIFIISSRVESQSVSTLEAMSTGLPVVCTTVIPDSMATELTSIIVPVEDTHALSTAIITMAKKYKSYDGLKIANYIRCISGRQVVGKELTEMYQSILSNICH